MATLSQAIKLAAFSGSVGATGNVIAQFLVYKSTENDKQPKTDSEALIPGYDPVQTLRFFVYSASFTQISYRWHAFLNKRFPIMSSSAATKPTDTMMLSTKAIQSMTERFGMALKRVAVDQTVFAPFATGLFVFGMGALEGLDTAGLAQRAKTQYMDILIAGYALWPAAQLINFSFVPLVYRVPFASTVSLFWNTYLGWKSCQAKRIENSRAAIKQELEINTIRQLGSQA